MPKAFSAGGSTILLGQRCVILPGKLLLFAGENFIKPYKFDNFFTLLTRCDTWKDKILSVLIGNKNDESLEYLLNFLLLLALTMTYTIYGLLSASEVTRIYRPKTSDDGKLKEGCLEGYYCDISRYGHNFYLILTKDQIFG